MRTRILAGGVVLAGVAVFIALLAGNLFGISPDFEDMTDGFRPIMDDTALATAQADVTALGDVSTEFATAVMPQLAGALGMDATALEGFLGQNFPAVATGVGALPTIADEFTNVVNVLESQQANFEKADQIPTSNLPATTMPWILLIITIGALVVAFLMFRKPVSGSLWAAAFGAVVTVAVLLLSFVPKAQAADDMNEALKPVYNQALVQGAEQSLQIVGAMGSEMQTSMMPALAQQLQLSQDQMNAFLGQFPATANVMQNLDAMSARFSGMVNTFGEQLPNYESIQDTALTPIAWTVLIAGLAIFLFGGVGFVVSAREE